MRRFALPLALLLAALPSPCALDFSHACRASTLGAPPAAASVPSWSPPPAAECVLRPPVPGTALHALLQNHSFPGVGADPYTDDQLLSIPDIASSGPEFYTFVYAAAPSALDVPCAPAPPAGARVVLTLAQASYRVTAYLDGAAVPLLGSGALQGVGMFTRWAFDLGLASAWCARPSHGLALLLAPPDHPGIPSAACALNLTAGPCGQGGNHGLAKDVVSQDLGGWDWVQASPDRNTGILDAVALALLPGGVLLRDGAVGLEGPLLKRSPAASAATVQAVMRASLQSAAPALALQGTLTFTLAGASAEVSVSLAAGFSGWLEVSSPPLLLQDVELWWPHTLGAPTLHAASARFVPSAPSGSNSSGLAPTTLEWAAGLRRVTAGVDAALGGQVFSINGLRTFLTGANWIATDLLSRASYRSAARLAAEVRMHREMGMNTMRLWGGHGGHPDALYEEADRQGILLFQEFFMSGDNNGRWAGSYDSPLDHALYLRAAEDTIRRLRGHASLLLWCGGNELFPFALSPPSDILAGLLDALARLDVARTPFVQSSMGGDERHNYSGFDPERALAPTDGPYGLLEPRSFHVRNPGKRNTSLAVAFQPEIGSSATPEFESLARFLSPSVREAMPGPRGLQGRAGAVWGFHAFEGWGDDVGGNQLFQFAPLGAGAVAGEGGWDAREYSWAGALAQHQQYQALFEGFQEYMWVYYSAVLVWKSAGPWPGLRGALYDHYLAPSGGFYGARAALGGPPLHVQLSRRWTQGGASVSLVNRGLQAVGPLTVTAQAYDLSTGRLLQASHWGVPSFPANAAQQVQGSALAWPAGAEANATLLWRLGVTGGSSSEYLLSTLGNSATAQPSNFSQLVALRASGQRLPLALARARATLPSAAAGVTVAVEGLGLAGGAGAGGVGLAVRCHLQDPATAVTAGTGFVDERVLPCFASGGFFALVPGQTVNLTLSAPQVAAQSSTLVVQCDGYNVAPLTVAPLWL